MGVGVCVCVCVWWWWCVCVCVCVCVHARVGVGGGRGGEAQHTLTRHPHHRPSPSPVTFTLTSPSLLSSPQFEWDPHFSHLYPPPTTPRRTLESHAQVVIYLVSKFCGGLPGQLLNRAHKSWSSVKVLCGGGPHNFVIARTSCDRAAVGRRKTVARPTNGRGAPRAAARLSKGRAFWAANQ